MQFYFDEIIFHFLDSYKVNKNKVCDVAVNVCKELGAGVCSGHGKCIGNFLYDIICQCDEGYGGIFCNETGKGEMRRKQILRKEILHFPVGVASLYQRVFFSKYYLLFYISLNATLPF